MVDAGGKPKLTASPAGDHMPPAGKGDTLRSAATDHQVVACSAKKEIAPFTTVQRVVARTAQKEIATTAPKEHVIALTPIEEVEPVLAHNDIITAPSKDDGPCACRDDAFTFVRAVAVARD